MSARWCIEDRGGIDALQDLGARSKDELQQGVLPIYEVSFWIDKRAQRDEVSRQASM